MASGHSYHCGYGLRDLQVLGLEFIPAADVVTAFGDLVNQMPDDLPMDEFLAYSKSTWIKGTTIGGRNRCISVLGLDRLQTNLKSNY